VGTIFALLQPLSGTDIFYLIVMHQDNLKKMDPTLPARQQGGVHLRDGMRGGEMVPTCAGESGGLSSG